MNLWDKYKTKLNEAGINTKLRKAHFFGQLKSESNFNLVAESLYYTSVQNARGAFYTPFKGKTNDFVISYLKDSKKMANYVYSNRMGNGSESSGDGYKYRGRGYIQLTGKDNYGRLSKALNVDYVSNPALLLNEADAMLAAIWFWNVNGLNKYADADDLDSISDIINMGKKTVAYGDANGFDKRKKNLDYYKSIF